MHSVHISDPAMGLQDCESAVKAFIFRETRVRCVSFKQERGIRAHCVWVYGSGTQETCGCDLADCKWVSRRLFTENYAPVWRKGSSVTKGTADFSITNGESDCFDSVCWLFG